MNAPENDARPELASWVEPFPDMPTLRRLSTPIDVIVDIARVFPAQSGFVRVDRLPLRVRAGGVQLESSMSGTLHAWLKLADGRWLAQVCVPAASANDRSHLSLWLWVEADRVSPRQSGQE